MTRYMKTPEQAMEDSICPLSMVNATVASNNHIAKCQGPRCMAWRWRYAKSSYYEKDSPHIPEGWVIDNEDDTWTTSDGRDKHCYRDPNEPNEGYCGLVAG